jgi:hypothetical protein
MPQKARFYDPRKNKCCKKGENSVKCEGRAAIPPDANKWFHAWCRKSNIAAN